MLQNRNQYVTLLFHDAYQNDDYDSSGFPGKAPSLYKIHIREMINHFKAINKVIDDFPSSIYSIANNKKPKIFVTFDDGGKSAISLISQELLKLGWIGHFFVTTDYIGKAAFLNENEIRELRNNGHIIGSHSCSHPHRMSLCNANELEYEWKESISKLSDILGEKVSSASVPGGYFSRNVAKVASECGVEFLFNSEPVKTAYYVDNCLVLGRYNILNSTKPVISGKLASRATSVAQLNQYLFWKLKSLAKNIGGKKYLQLRERILKLKLEKHKTI